MIQGAIESYASVIARYPKTVLVLSLAVMVVLGAGGSRVETVEQQTEDFLPDSIDSVAAFDTIGSEFRQGGTRFTVLVETSPGYPGSNELRDVRDPRMVRYIRRIDSDLSRVPEVETVSSMADILPGTYSSKREVQDALEAVPSSRFISDDYTATQVQVTSSGLSENEQLELGDTIKNVFRNERPPGVKISFTGDVFINQAFQRETENTMQTTSMASLIAVMVIVVLLFRSFFDGFASLQALIFGIIAGFGVYGWIGLNMSPATSGALSMGIGIAIDFGIQTVSRYREEKNSGGTEEALQESLKGVISPMSVALVSAIIGFAALGAGRITFLSELGTLLAFTTTLAFVGALTVIPASLAAYDRHFAGTIERMIGR